MRAEIAICDTADTTVVDLIRDLTDRSVILKRQHRDLTVMVSGYKQIAVLVVGGQITATHTVDRCLRDVLQSPVLFDLIAFHPVIRNGIQIFPVVRDRHIRGIGDLHPLFFVKNTVFHIHIVYTDAHLAAPGIAGHIRHDL